MPQSVDSLLQKHELRKTSCRRAMLSYFVSKEEAVAVSDLNTHLGESFDRATIYRTTQSFLENGIIHKVLDTNEGPKYALCHDCDHVNHSDEHVHFLCIQCGKSICLDDLIPEVKLPEGYTLSSKNMLLEGHCPNCN